MADTGFRLFDYEAQRAEQLKIAAASGGITKMQNPITRSMVRIEPPFICSDPHRYGRFEQHFWKWCEALWEINMIDPDVLISDRDWLLSDKFMPVIEGFMPPVKV